VITSYRILIVQQDGAFSEDTLNCDGSDSGTLAALQCTIPLLDLQTYPYSLQLGDSIFAKVSATNLYGESAFSESGNGATIVLVPSAPVNLANNLAVTTKSVIGITWKNGASTGGSPLIDY
jgi:hypothetical protein